MDPFGLPEGPHFDIQTFYGSGSTIGRGWQTWKKPRGKSMANIFLVGSGGNGGNGTVGAASLAGGGAGGSSGSQVSLVCIPLAFLPEVLFLNLLGGASVGSDLATSVIAIQPDTTSAHAVAFANNGTVGADASFGNGGSGAAGGSAPQANQMRLGWPWALSALAGNSGGSGSNTGNGTGLVIPTTGLRVMGGCGGAGLPAAATAGNNGGGYTAIASPSLFPVHNGGQGSATATAPADNGSHGYEVNQIGQFFLGGTGGASTHGSATGGGLVGSRGGDGAPGCGGGGAGGALTASSQGIGGKGGPAMAIITCW